MELSDEDCRRSLNTYDNSDDDRAGASNEADRQPVLSDENNAEDGDEDGDGTKRKIKPVAPKRFIKNPQPKLNAECIRSVKGVQTIEQYFEGFEYHGAGREKEDLDRIMKRLEHWAYRLFPRYRFDDFIDRMEVLGDKKDIRVFLKKYRLGMESADQVPLEGLSDGLPIDEPDPVATKSSTSEFDALIAEQIELQKANEKARSFEIVPEKPVTAAPIELTDEMKARIRANRELALMKKMAREKLKATELQKDSVESPSPILNENSLRMDQSQDVDTNNAAEDLNTPQGNPRIAEVESQTVQAQKLPDKVPEYERFDSVLSPDIRRIGTSEETESISEDSQKALHCPSQFEDTVETAKYKNSAPMEPNTARRSSQDEELLSHEQLLMAIDEAMEDIIEGKDKPIDDVI